MQSKFVFSLLLLIATSAYADGTPHHDDEEWVSISREAALTKARLQLAKDKAELEKIHPTAAPQIKFESAGKSASIQLPQLVAVEEYGINRVATFVIAGLELARKEGQVLPNGMRIVQIGEDAAVLSLAKKNYRVAVTTTSAVQVALPPAQGHPAAGMPPVLPGMPN